jgi:predicted XRE-type DNA-binding protein
MTIEHTTPAEGNIFADLQLQDAENLKLRAMLMQEVKRYVEKSGLTQVEAASRLGTTQPRLNDILKGDIEKCTIDRLVNMLTEVDVHISLRIDRAA